MADFDTKILDKDLGMAEAARLIRAGEVLGMPTETVYGLGANAFDEAAIQKVFRLKNRPADNPLIVHLASVDHCQKLIGRQFSPLELKIARRFWPGPLSMVIEDESGETGPERGPFGFAKNVSCGLTASAIRIPLSQVTRTLIEIAGVPVAAPSANVSGKPSSTSAAHVYADFKGKISAILDGGDCVYGLESTVIRLDGDTVLIMREGSVTAEELKSVAGEDKVFFKTKEKVEKLMCPGLKYKHYAPDAETFLVNGSKEFFCRTVLAKIAENVDRKVGVLCFEDTKRMLRETIANEQFAVFDLGNDEKSAAHRLYKGLRELDSQSADVIMAEGVAPVSLGATLMDRLTRACSGNVVNQAAGGMGINGTD